MTTDEYTAIITEAVEAGCYTSGSDFLAGRRLEGLTAADQIILRDLADRLGRRSPRILALSARDTAGARVAFVQAYLRSYHQHLSDLGEGVQRDVAALVREVRSQL